MERIRRAVTLPGIALVIATLATLPASMQELEIATSVSMLEGPTVDADGNVYFTDILMERITRFSKDGKFSVFREKATLPTGWSSTRKGASSRLRVPRRRLRNAAA